MADFKQLLDKLLKDEGLYADHKDDAGGKTKYGVTEGMARKFGYKGLMRDLPLDLAKNIYAAEFWTGPKFDAVHEYSELVAGELFNTAVLHGPVNATVFLQRLLNVLNQQGKAWPDLALDGAIGEATLTALDAYLRARGKEGETVLYNMLNALQGAYLVQRCEARTANESFAYGWFRHRITFKELA